MHAHVRDSRTYLERWIDQQGIQRSDLTRIFDGFDLSLQDGRTPDNELQQPQFYVPGLTASPWWDKEDFPWVSVMEQAFSNIKAEFQALGGITRNNAVRHPTGLDDHGRWSAYYFFYAGRRYADHAKQCPQTLNALSSVPGASECGMAYFSIADPHTHITPHCGFTNTHLRCHLGLEIPPDCQIRVGGETRTWISGQVNVFDDSFNHEVWNNSDEGRAILLFDAWHPDLTEVETAALAYVVSVWRKFIYMNLVTGGAAKDATSTVHLGGPERATL